MVCSQGAGVDQNGAAVNLGFPPSAVSTGATGQLRTAGLQTTGGVDTPANFGLVSGASGAALTVTQRLQSDPFLYLPTPTTASGVLARYPDAQGNLQASPQNVSVIVNDNSTYTLVPGTYSSITVTGSGLGRVIFQPGVYVLLGGLDPALQIAASASVQGAGVLFYNTGSDYSPLTGLPDAADGNIRPGAPTTGTTFGGVSIQAGSLSLSGLSDPNSPFAGVLFYQRRANTRPLSIQGAAATDSVQGTLYARWANLTLSGPGNYQAQFITGSLAVSAPATAGNLTISQGTSPGKAAAGVPGGISEVPVGIRWPPSATPVKVTEPPGRTPPHMAGALRYPRGCDPVGDCLLQGRFLLCAVDASEGGCVRFAQKLAQKRPSNQVASHHPDIVFMDIGMEGLTCSTYPLTTRSPRNRQRPFLFRSDGLSTHARPSREWL